MSIAEQVAEYVKHRPYGSIFTHKQLVNHLGGHDRMFSEVVAFCISSFRTTEAWKSWVNDSLGIYTM